MGGRRFRHPYDHIFQLFEVFTACRRHEPGPFIHAPFFCFAGWGKAQDKPPVRPCSFGYATNTPEPI
jgi:hypothetical protein